MMRSNRQDGARLFKRLKVIATFRTLFASQQGASGDHVALE